MKVMKKENIPNLLSLFRILLVPVYILSFFAVFPFFNGDSGIFASGIIFVLAGITDAADGFLARKKGWISDTGKLLDPLADKLMELSVSLCLAIRMRGLFIVLAAIIFLKEIIMVTGAYLILSKRKVVVFSVWYGKAATCIWYVLICLVTFFRGFRESRVFCNALCIALIVIMALAFIMYMRAYRREISDTKTVLRENRHTHKAERKAKRQKRKKYRQKRKTSSGKRKKVKKSK